MPVFETIEPLSQWLQTQRKSGASIGFVPTMGALHRGHLSLVERALQENDRVVASIFVNPTQFNNPDDLRLYPRMVEEDLSQLRAAGCHAVFLPPVEVMYPSAEKGHWDFGLLSAALEGRFRPGHFDGVLTIVRKFFLLLQPDKSYFGEKDFQQLAHIRRLVHDEAIPVEVIGCPTLREPDGLAMSSRNLRLSQEERTTARHLSRVLFAMKEKKGSLDPSALEAWGREELRNVEGLRLEYLEIVDPQTFAPLTEWDDYPEAIALCAAYIGEVRLIDNIRM